MFRSYDIKNTLRDLFPAASSSEIDSALHDADGNADEAAQQLLGLLCCKINMCYPVMF